MNVTMAKRSCKSSADDRFSDLPDELVTPILSALPTKDVAVTRLLSKRFLPAFSLLTSLDFDDTPRSHDPKFPDYVQHSPKFMKFVDYVLQACQSSNQLDRFMLRFGRFCGDKKRFVLDPRKHPETRYHPEIEPTRLNAWISFSLTRSVRELDLCINVKKSTQCRELPRSIFMCETLEMLKLESNLDLDVDNVNAFQIRLPRLKLLHLRTILFKEDEFVTKLVKSCPLLEDLLLDCWWDCGDVLVISSPSLLKLDLGVQNTDEFKTGDNVTIQTPNLRTFKYVDNLARHYSVSNMPDLVEADISIVEDVDTGADATIQSICNFLKTFSTVPPKLSLKGNSVKCLNHIESKDRLPVFHNLTHLELGCCSRTFWDKALVPILECSPSLQTLVFPEAFSYPDVKWSPSGFDYNPDWDGIGDDEEVFEGYERERECWRTTQGIPLCCKSSLKNIVIKQFRGLTRERLVVEFLLKKALVLESLVISLIRKVADIEFYDVLLQSFLRVMPRASTLCSIEVNDCCDNWS